MWGGDEGRGVGDRTRTKGAKSVNKTYFPNKSSFSNVHISGDHLKNNCSKKEKKKNNCSNKQKPAKPNVSWYSHCGKQYGGSSEN